jgi:hypothetical protein
MSARRLLLLSLAFVVFSSVVFGVSLGVLIAGGGSWS